MRLQPAFPAAYVDRARALSRSGNLVEARADCELALQHDRQQAPAYLVRGSVLAQQGQFAGAIEDFRLK